MLTFKTHFLVSAACILPLISSPSYSQIAQDSARARIFQGIDNQIYLDLELKNGQDFNRLIVRDPESIDEDILDVPIIISGDLDEINSNWVVNGSVPSKEINYVLGSLAAPEFTFRDRGPTIVNDKEYNEAEESLGVIKGLLNSELQTSEPPSPMIIAERLKELKNKILVIKKTILLALRSEDYEAAALLALDYANLMSEAEQIATNTKNPIATEIIGTTLKASYGADDSISTSKLDVIYEQKQNIVGIARSGNPAPHCTGTFLKPNIILTAVHCLKYKDPKVQEPVRIYPHPGIDILFGFEDYKKPIRVRATILAPKRIDSVSLADGDSDLDYVLLEIPTNDVPPIANGEMCLSTTLVQRGEIVYSFGHPKGTPLKFHSNGSVYLPYGVSTDDPFVQFIFSLGEDEFQSYLAQAEYKGPLSKDYDLSKGPLQIQALQQLTAVLELANVSYQETDGELLKLNYTRNLLKADRIFEGPSMSVSLDFSGGDSGAPVITTNGNQCVIGILKKGIDDSRKEVWVNWFNNETITPIESIIADLSRKDESTETFNTIAKRADNSVQLILEREKPYIKK